MNKYIGTKIIQAEPQIRFKEGAQVPGMKVIYENGYESWTPEDAFEKAYRRSDNMPFGLAIEAAKMGKKIARQGWNGSGMYAYYVPAANYPAKTDAAREEFGEMVPYRHYLALKTAQNDVATWSPSTSDALADDWFIFEQIKM